MTGCPIRISEVNSAPYRLTPAFRRLARPSSPPDAMASTMCAFLLDHTTPSDMFLLLFTAVLALKSLYVW